METWHACSDCKHFTGRIVKTEKMITAHGHTSKRKKIMFECIGRKTGTLPWWIGSAADLKVKHDTQCPFEPK